MSRGEKGVVALVAIIVALAIGEVVVRSTKNPPGLLPMNPREDSLFSPNLNLGYSLRPGTHHFVTAGETTTVAISSDGLRDTTIAAASQAQVRVLAVGDAFTLGLGVAAESTWCKQLERLLAQRNPRRTVRVLNGGVAGFSPRQIRIRELQLARVLHPQAIVYELTTQTFGRMYNPNVWYGFTLARSEDVPNLLITKHGLLYTPYRNLWMRKLDVWMNLHFELGAHLLRRGSVMLGQIPRERPDMRRETDSAKIRELFQPTLDELSAARSVAAEAKTPFIVLLANPQNRDGSFSAVEETYNRIVGEYCRAHDIHYVDLLPALTRAAGGRPLFREPYDQHWTPAAHAIAARALADSLHLGPPPKS